MSYKKILNSLCSGLELSPMPDRRERSSWRAHASVRTPNFSKGERELAIKNALRYFPSNLHKELVGEFSSELDQYGHIYMYRFMPNVDEIK
jgi:urocanate hydratase